MVRAVLWLPLLLPAFSGVDCAHGPAAPGREASTRLAAGPASLRGPGCPLRACDPGQPGGTHDGEQSYGSPRSSGAGECRGRRLSGAWESGQPPAVGVEGRPPGTRGSEPSLDGCGGRQPSGSWEPGEPPAVGTGELPYDTCGAEQAAGECTGQRPSGACGRERAAGACGVGAWAAETGGTFTIALPQAVEPGDAPVPRSDAERFVYRQLYETLVRVDCRGAVRPGLAESWSVGDDGLVWSFRLRPGAVFWNGSPVRAGDVKSSWEESRRRAGGETGLLPWAYLDPQAVVADGPDRLTITLRRPAGASPALFSDPALAVSRPWPGRRWAVWPMGSGPYQIREDKPDGANGERLLILERGGGLDPDSPERPVLRVRARPGADPRDLLAQGADAVLLRDRTSLAYALALPDHRAEPLTWDRLYVLVSGSTGASRAAARGWNPAALGTGADLFSWKQSLARDVVAGDARPAAASELGCGRRDEPDAGGAMAGSEPPGAGERVLFPAGDADAERLAERLVATIDSSTAPLGAGAPGAPFSSRPRRSRGAALVAAGLPPEQFRAALGRGEDTAYVLRLSPLPPPSCLRADALRAALGQAPGACAAPPAGTARLAASGARPTSPADVAPLAGGGARPAPPAGTEQLAASGTRPTSPAETAPLSSSGAHPGSLALTAPPAASGAPPPPPAVAPCAAALGRVVVPLVATRPYLVVRAGLAGFRMDGDGTLDATRAGWVAPAGARGTAP